MRPGPVADDGMRPNRGIGIRGTLIPESLANRILLDPERFPGERRLDNIPQKTRELVLIKKVLTPEDSLQLTKDFLG